MSTYSHLFPITLKTQWKTIANVTSQNFIHEGVFDWLIDPSSLTARLKQHSNKFSIEVLGQQVQPCSQQEANEDIAEGEQVLVREVLLFCDEKPQVFARSLLPLSSLTGDEQKLAELGEQSLGQVLFNHVDLIRKGFEIANFDQESSLTPLLNALHLSQSTPLWGRRSVFIVKDKPIMVAEVFLPDSIAYRAKYNQA